MTLYIRVPFGTSGDKTTIPVTGAAAGPVNYTYGFGTDYSLPRDTNPSALNVERVAMNEVLFDITSNIQQYQQYGFPWFITTSDNGGMAFQYAKNAVVRYDNGTTIENYISLVDSNDQLPTVTTNWAKISGNVAFLNQANTFTAKQTIQLTSTQLQVGYDNSNYFTAAVASNGAVTFDAVGAGAGFTFSDGVTVTGTLALGANSLTMTGSIGATGARVIKGWFVDLQVTNAIAGSITGNAATVTTNANLTGAIVSTGNATVLGSFSSAALASAVTDETGTGALVFANSPALTGTPTAPTPSSNDNSTKIATTAYVDAAVPSSSIIPHSAISGFIPSFIAGTSTTASLSISAGQASNSANTIFFTGVGYSWAVSNGNAANGYQGGTTLPNSSTIHFYVIALAADTTWTASFASTSLAPTLPGSYTKYRRVFSLRTSGAGAPLPYVALEIAGGSLDCTLATSVLDVNTTFGTSRTATALSSIPAGVSMEAKYLSSMTAGSGGSVRLTGLNEPDLAPSQTVAGLADLVGNGQPNYGSRKLITDTSAQIGIRAAGAGVSVGIATLGWIDFRR